MTGRSGCGLRERKKQRTRTALVTEAHRLFAARGYEHTTTEQIAAAVNVSQRTLFRYFANKDEIALAALEELHEMFLAEMARRPRSEPPMAALRGATWALFDRLEDPDEAGLRDAVIFSLDLVHRTPTLLAANLGRMAESEDRLVAEAVRRAGAGESAELRARLTVAAYDGALRIAHASWTRVGEAGGLPALRVKVAECLDLLPEILAG